MGNKWTKHFTYTPFQRKQTIENILKTYLIHDVLTIVFSYCKEQNHVVILGGTINGGHAVSNSVLIYDVGCNTWMEVNPTITLDNTNMDGQQSSSLVTVSCHAYHYSNILKFNSQTLTASQTKNLPRRIPTFIGGIVKFESSHNNQIVELQHGDCWESNLTHPFKYHGYNISYLTINKDGLDTWTSCQPPPFDRVSFVESITYANNENTLFALGGTKMNLHSQHHSQHRSKCYKFNIVSKKWTSMASLHVARAGAVACVVEQYVVICGGYDVNKSQILRSVERYDTKKDVWTIVKSIPRNLPIHAVTLPC